MKPLFPIDLAAGKTKPPVTPLYSLHGYIIQPDGTTWALFEKWTHGFVLALLYPEVAAAYTDRALEYPDSIHEVDVFAFQAFEMDRARDLQCVRICSARLMSPGPSVDLPHDGCTPEQKEALRIVMYVALGHGHNDTVNMTSKDVTLRELMALSTLDDEARLNKLYGNGNDQS